MKSPLTSIGVALICLLSSCATFTNPGCGETGLPPGLLELSQRSCRGDQHAALKLGIYYQKQAEQSNDQDLYGKAAQLYTLAAAASTGQSFIYIPGAGEVPGYTMPVQTGPSTSGLPEAHYRLSLLYRDGLGVNKDSSKAEKHMKRATDLGFSAL